jgi:tetratricopeptide (TPR) repeat protein
MKSRPKLMALLVFLPLVTGCSDVRARMAFKEGNKLYKEENYRKAIDEYDRAIALNPSMAEAYFYLGSSHQALFRPGKDDGENKQHLDAAIQNYTKAMEVNTGDTENAKKVRINTLGALTGIYAEPPYQDFTKALDYAQQLVKDNPDDSKNLYALANLYEKFGKVDEAEKSYRRITELNPEDAKACAALAGFFNKPLWDEAGAVYDEKTAKGGRRSRFDLAIETLQRCASLDPKDASGYFKVATFYWDKAYRDPSVTDAQKAAYAESGLAAAEKALSIKPDYWEALIYKGLLYRVKALISKNPRERAEFLDQAATLQKQAMDLKKSLQADTSVPPEAASGEAPPATN